MKHTLVATMEDGPATLNRVVSLFRQRGFAIDSLTIGRTHEPHIMRLTMVVDGSKTAVEQVVKQLYKVIEVRKVSDLTDDQTVERELALIKVTSKNATMRAEIMQITDIYRARIVDVAMGSLTIEVTGPTDKIESIIGLLKPYGIKEMVRTGLVVMTRGAMAGLERGREAIRAVS
ncbi:MAG TPA: acetolactate synthase small subunit [Chloroflexota bacterium]|nr:acetolactate synthase small subunit [Chloroflexota bacterium]